MGFVGFTVGRWLFTDDLCFALHIGADIWKASSSVSSLNNSSSERVGVGSIHSVLLSNSSSNT